MASAAIDNAVLNDAGGLVLALQEFPVELAEKLAAKFEAMVAQKTGAAAIGERTRETILARAAELRLLVQFSNQARERLGNRGEREEMSKASIEEIAAFGKGGL